MLAKVILAGCRILCVHLFACLYFLTFLQQKCITFLLRKTNKCYKLYDPNGIYMDHNHKKYTLFMITWEKNAEMKRSALTIKIQGRGKLFKIYCEGEIYIYIYNM